MLLMRAVKEPILVLCARELQVSIQDSVHKLLSDMVKAMGYVREFRVLKTEIVGKNGSRFVFRGLRHNVSEIKSLEAVDVCWVEEAQSVSDESWQELIPTIRKSGSQIWLTFNPARREDPTYTRFVLNTPPESLVRRVNYDENPWFTRELEMEREYMERTDQRAYAHVWLGECVAFSDAEVLAGKWVVDRFDPEEGWGGPYYGADWGFAVDPTVLVRCWINGRQLMIDSESYGVGVTLNHTARLFDEVPGARKHRIRADSSRPETINHVSEFGFDVRPAVKWEGSIEDGVEFLRSFERIVIHERCRHTAEEARLWSYKRDRLTNDILPHIVDKHNHCWDAIRYALSPLIRMRKSALWLEARGKLDGEERQDQLQPVRDILVAPAPGTCGACKAFRDGLCTERDLEVGLNDPGCPLWI